MTITNADIVSRLKLLADKHLKADSGTDTTLLCTELTGNGDITHNYICFINGDNAGTDRIVLTYDDPSGTATFDALTIPVTNTDEFCIVSPGYQSDVLQAEDVIRNDLRNKGYDLDLFLDEPQLREMYIYQTISLVCAGLMNDGDDQDVYYVNYQRFLDRYNLECASLIADYDANEDGTIDEGEENMNIGQVGFVR